jgi:predicted secreted hydrolase
LIGPRPAWLLFTAACLFGGEFRFREALPGYVYHFPADHFEHPDFRTEWWYYTGNLTDSANHRFGFELVFFRQAERRGESSNRSAWRVDDVYLAHAALTDIDGKRFLYSERTNRAGPGIAGASGSKAAIWNGNWRAEWTGEKQRLSVLTDEFQFDLRAEPLKPLVIHGIEGVSQKADGVGRASHYISFPRLGVTGHVQAGGKDHEVQGLAWMDHEWFTGQLDASERGWDWFSVQLQEKPQDNTELMLFDLRRTDGTIDSHSSGTYVNAQGKPRHLTASEFTLRPITYWGKYPVKWRIEVPSLHLKLDCEAALKNQELKTRGTNYWEGAVVYTGTSQGVGYLEMTGYDKPVSFQ